MELIVNKGAVRSGYKKTEIGVIPNDWGPVPLGELGTFSKGQGIRKDDAQSGELPCVRYGELYTRHNDYIKQYHSFISPSVALTSKRLKIGDILFAGSGETKEEIGKCAAFIDDIEAYVGGDVVILSPVNVDSLFLGFLLNSPIAVKQKSSKGQGDAVVHISASSLQKIKIPLPPIKAEQSAIAATLKDVDTLIQSIERLIGKKQLIKQGVMKELLRPKKGWKVMKLPEVCWFQEGPGLRDWQFRKSGIKVINVTNLENGYLNLDRTDRHISLEEFNKMYRHFEIDVDDIVVASSGNSYAKISVVREQDLPLVMNTSVIRFKPLKDLDYNYLLVFLKSNLFKKQIDLLITGGAQPNFGPAHLNLIDIATPPTLEEQIGIASILIDLDVEIESLKASKAKYMMIKQGMMQNLLTGKIRLI